MVIHRWKIAAGLAGLGLAVGSAIAGGVPSGLGGFVWRSATAQGNTLRGVSAPSAGSGGTGFAATGDACTLLFRLTPLSTGASGWFGGRGRSVSPEVQYRGVKALDGGKRIAVAANDGTVLIGGNGLFRTFSVSEHALNAVDWSLNGTESRLAIVGDSGAAYTYDSAKDRIIPATINLAPGQPADLFALSFPGNGPVGFAGGDVPAQGGPRGALFKTLDGGETWTWLSGTPGTDAFLDVFFLTPVVGFALGVQADGCVVYVTRNGGATWQTVAETDGTMRAIAAFDLEHIVLVGGAGILVSTDGATFLPRGEPVAGLVTQLALEDVDASGTEAWAVGEGGVVFASYDRGITWTVFSESGVLEQSALQDLTALRYLSDTSVLVAGTDGKMLLSEDAGKTYRPVPGVGQDAIHALATPGARNAGIGAGETGPVLAVGARRTVGLLQPSTDQAALIGAVPSVDYAAVAMYQAAAGVRAWAVGQNGTIVSSDADSPVWSRQTSGIGQDLTAVHVTETATQTFNVLACGSGGVILRSTNGTQWGPCVTGGSITPLPSPFTLTNLRGIAFRTPAQGIVVGDGGIAARTANGGLNWLVQQPLPGVRLMAVSVLPATFTLPEAWIVGEHQTVLRTENGGQTWQVLPPPVAGTGGLPPPDIAFRTVKAMAPGAAFLAGDEGHLLFTANAGSSWTELGTTISDTYRALCVEPSGVGVAAAENVLTGSRVDVTNDAWHTSGNAVLPSSPPILYGAALLGTQSIVVGADGFIARCFGTAGNPNPDFTSDDGAIRSVVSPQAGQYVAAGDGGLLMWSGDSGSTWRRAEYANPYGPDVQLKAISFALPEITGIAAGYAAGGTPGGTVPVLLKTLDSGRTWTPVNPQPGQIGATINGLAMFSNHVLAAAANGVVYSYAGQSWSVDIPVPGFSGSWNAVSATDGRWYVAGERGHFARYPATSAVPGWGKVITGAANDIHTLAGPPYPSGGGAGLGGGIESLRDDIRGFAGEIGMVMSTESGGAAMFGDVSGDLVVSIADIVSVLRVAAGLDLPTPEVFYYGDVEPAGATPDTLPGDGLLEPRDAVRILRLMYGL